MYKSSRKLIEFLESIDFKGIKNSEYSWKELAKRFGPTRDEDWARQVWKKYKKDKINKPQYKGLTLSRIEKNRADTVVKKVFTNQQSQIPVKEEDFNDFEITKITQNPYGSAWIKAERKKESFFTESQIKEALDQLKDTCVNLTITSREVSKVGCIDIADIHLGLITLLGIENIRFPEFNTQVVEHYLSQIVSIVNSYNFSEVHLFFPGDLIESFSGKNRNDTWKIIEKYPQNIIIVCFNIIKEFIQKITNVKGIYFVEGNHDRFTGDKEHNSRKGLAEVISFFLMQTSNLEVLYHPYLLTKEIDGIFHIMTHGDLKPYQDNKTKKPNYGAFLYKYGKKGMFNVLKTGHYHDSYKVLYQGLDFLHYQCASLCTGKVYEESLNYESNPCVTIFQVENALPRIDYRPLKIYSK